LWHYENKDFLEEHKTVLHGCDSIVEVRIFVPIPDCTVHDTLKLNPCDEYTYFGNINNGITFDSDFAFTDTLVSFMGCDSLLRVELYFRFSVTKDTFGQNCLFYTWNDSIYYESGRYTQIFEASNGCDSVVNKIITILEKTFGELILDSCDQVTYKDSVYLINTTFFDTLFNQNQWDCDSIVEVHIFVRECPPPPPNIDTTEIYVYWHRVLAVPNRNNLDELRYATYYWHRNDTLLPQSRKDWIEVGPPIPAGKYQVWIVHEGDTISYAERDFDDPFFGVLVYPNPLNMSEELNIEAHTTIRRIELFLNGVLQKLPIRITDKGYTISGFTVPGVYILQVLLENQNVETIKIVVQ
jgi:hypothetical protein